MDGPSFSGFLTRVELSAHRPSRLYLVIELLKQVPELQCRPDTAIRHHRHSNITFAIDMPTANGLSARSRITFITFRPALTALPLQPGDAALARRGNKLPSRTGTRARCVFEGDERTAIAGDDIIPVILGGFIECAADFHALAVAAGSRKANPVRVRWRLTSIANGAEIPTRAAAGRLSGAFYVAGHPVARSQRSLTTKPVMKSSAATS